jgi:hypothetical protein
MLSPSAPTPPRTVARRFPLRSGTLGFCGLAACWLGLAASGFALLERHNTAPGELATVPGLWPVSTALPRADGGRWTLLLFAHPKCPCTRATVGEAEIVLARHAERVRACVVFVRPEGVPEGWERSGLFERASKIPGTAVRVDEGGREAARFGALTSGTVLLYDPEGRLRFEGGITASRGHSGDNAGRAAVEALLETRGLAEGATSRAAVFGCPLGTGACCSGGDACSR